MEAAEEAPLFGAGDDGSERRQGDTYTLTAKEIEAYKQQGYIRLPSFLTPEEVDGLESVFDRFCLGKGNEMGVPGKDFCDMSQKFGVPFEKWRLVNAMLPRQYYPPLEDNILERRALSIAKQLLGRDMEYDYDQFLCKKPSSDGAQNGAVFAWHQDLAYWPQNTPDYRTVTVSLALNDATRENGCLRVVPGSQKEKNLREHRPLLGGGRDDAHALTVDLKEGDKVLYLPLRRGDVTVHDERIVHGSDGNTSKEHSRKTYVIAFRSEATIAAERKLGFTHSHNTDHNWESWISAAAASAAASDEYTHTRPHTHEMEEEEDNEKAKEKRSQGKND